MHETAISHHCDNLNRYNIHTMFEKCEFSTPQSEIKLVNSNVQTKKRDSYVNKIEDLDQKRESLSELFTKPNRNLSAIVSKAASPFTVAPNLQKNDSLKSSESHESKSVSLTTNKHDRESVDVWRASEFDKDSKPKEKSSQDETENKDEILSQWLKSSQRRENDTITEVDEENAEESRCSKTSIHTIEDRKQIEPIEEQDEEEEENELHKIHMLQSLQALQYMKKVVVPSLDEISDKFVYLPPPKAQHLKKTLIFDMDETLIH